MKTVLHTAGKIKLHELNQTFSEYFLHVPFQNVWNHSVLKTILLYLFLLPCVLVVFSFRLIYLKLDSHGHSGDEVGMRIGGAKDERHFKSEQG